jgi:hypothetical protein
VLLIDGYGIDFQNDHTRQLAVNVIDFTVHDENQSTVWISNDLFCLSVSFSAGQSALTSLDSYQVNVFTSLSWKGIPASIRISITFNVFKRSTEKWFFRTDRF